MGGGGGGVKKKSHNIKLIINLCSVMLLLNYKLKVHNLLFSYHSMLILLINNAILYIYNYRNLLEM